MTFKCLVYHKMPPHPISASKLRISDPPALKCICKMLPRMLVMEPSPTTLHTTGTNIDMSKLSAWKAGFEGNVILAIGVPQDDTVSA